MTKKRIGLLALLATAGVIVLAIQRPDESTDPIARYNAVEQFYAELDTLQNRMRAVEDPEILEQLFGANFEYVSARKLELARAYPSNDIGYTPHELAVVDQYTSLTAYAESYIGGVMGVWSEGFTPNTIEIRKPFIYPFNTRSTLKTVTLTDGQTLQITEQDETTALETQAHRNSYDDVEFKAPEGVTISTPASVLLEVEVTVPSNIATLRFDDVAIGDAQVYDIFKVTVTDLTDQYAQVTVSREDGNAIDGSPLRIEVEARDSSGHPISREQQFSGNLQEHERTIAAINESILLAENADDADRAKVEELFEDGPNLIASSSFQGKVVSLDVYIVDHRSAQKITRELDLAVLDLPKYRDTPQEIPFDTEVIDPRLLILTDGTPDVFAPGEIKQIVSIWQDRASVDFALPPRVSDLFISGHDRIEQNGDLDFGWANRNIPHDDWDLYNVNSMRIDFIPEAFPKTPRHVSGDVAVNILDLITRERLALDALPDGISVLGNRITVSGAFYGPVTGNIGGFASSHDDNIQSTIKVIALNPEGRPLERFFRADHTVDEDRQANFYYHGKPSSIMLLRRGALSETVLPVDQALNVLAFELGFN